MLVEQLYERIEETQSSTLGDIIWLDEHNCHFYKKKVCLSPASYDLTPFIFQSAVFNSLYSNALPKITLEPSFKATVLYHNCWILVTLGKLPADPPEVIYSKTCDYITNRLLLLDKLVSLLKEHA
jgi:hypothetical protein